MPRLAVTCPQGPVLTGGLALGRLAGLCLCVTPHCPSSGFGLGNHRLWVAVSPGLSGVALVYAGCPGLISDRALVLSK